MAGIGSGAGVDSTWCGPVPSLKSIVTVTVGLAPAVMCTFTWRRDGSRISSASTGVTPGGITVDGPCSIPGSVDGHGPVVVKLLVVAVRKQ